jgi:signal transduction histidine kinase
MDENGQSLLSKSMLAFEGSTKLIDNVRKLQKVKSGEPHKTEMDIGQVLKDVQYHYSHLHERNVSISYIPVIGYVVSANELLYDLFSNLIGNSIKHSNGNPVINIKVEQLQENNIDYFKVSIDDNGPGIPDDLKPLIFNRRLNGSLKSRGSGIGLFLVKTLVDNYSGIIWVEDRIHGDHTKGAKFVVMLPASNK